MPKWAFRVDAAPLGSEEPSVTLKLSRMTVAEMNIFRPYSSSQPFGVTSPTHKGRQLALDKLDAPSAEAAKLSSILGTRRYQQYCPAHAAASSSAPKYLRYPEI
ncbi:hypothetical protein VCV18_012430 [Metarhizium anisopliae]